MYISICKYVLCIYIYIYIYIYLKICLCVSLYCSNIYQSIIYDLFVLSVSKFFLLVSSLVQLGTQIYNLTLFIYETP